jgi:hypothetical protein
MRNCKTIFPVFHVKARTGGLSGMGDEKKKGGIKM